jgi:hypothetical protein
MSLDAYGIRFHGRVWLKNALLTDGMRPNIGWRPFVWTKNADLAEKFGNEAGARHFAERYCRGPFEIVQIPRISGSVDRPA